MRILFVDHVMHRLTSSSAFFLDILKERYEVDTAYLEPDITGTHALAEFERRQDWAGYDLVIAWQLEAVAAITSQHGVPTLLAPMFDGSGVLTEKAWALYRDCSMLHFSYTLHARTRDIIPHQKYIQYYPDPAAYKPVDHSMGAKVFFWMRRPEDLDLGAVLRLVRSGFDSIHVHLKPDRAGEKLVLPEWAASYNITSSSWFDKRSDYDALLDQHTVLVCPRLAEGIGMVMLEGLARGMCVLAHREPTHTEYIADGINGYLFDRLGYTPPDIRRREQLGRMARRGVEDGYARWRRQLEELPSFLEACAMRGSRPFCSPQSARTLVMQSMTDHGQYVGHAEYLVDDLRGAHAPASAAKGDDDTEAAAPKTAKGAPAAAPSADADADGGDDGVAAGNGVNGLLAPVQAVRFSRGQADVDRVRLLMRSVPGWSRIKGLVPLGLKRRIATELADRLGGWRG